MCIRFIIEIMIKRKDNKMRYIKDNGGREKYFQVKFKKDLTSDCVIRAIAIATGNDYKEVMTELFKIGLEIGQMPNNKKCYEIYLNKLGWEKHKPIRKVNGKKYKVKNMPIDHTNMIVHTSKHLTTIIQGNLHDTWDCREWCANSYYIKGVA